MHKKCNMRATYSRRQPIQNTIVIILEPNKFVSSLDHNVFEDKGRSKECMRWEGRVSEDRITTEEERKDGMDEEVNITCLILDCMLNHRHPGRQRGRQQSLARPRLLRAPHRGPFDGHSEAGPSKQPLLNGRLP